MRPDGENALDDFEARMIRGLHQSTLAAASLSWHLVSIPEGWWSIVLSEGDKPIVCLEIRGPCKRLVLYHPTEETLKAGTLLGILPLKPPGRRGEN